MAIFLDLKSIDSLRAVILNEVYEFGFLNGRCCLHLLARRILSLSKVPRLVEVGGGSVSGVVLFVRRESGYIVVSHSSDLEHLADRLDVRDEILALLYHFGRHTCLHLLIALEKWDAISQ